MTEELSKVYEPRQIERLADEIWQKGNYFHTEPPTPSLASQEAEGESKSGGRKTKPYTIVIPPPRVRSIFAFFD